jgi:predicted AlkP superfamily pyrophosphatase or phosphodiesterase
MNIDDAGHRTAWTAASTATARAAPTSAGRLPAGWLEAGYQVLVTADHGMNNDRSHNGLLAEEREVPLFVFGDAFSLDPRQAAADRAVRHHLRAAGRRPRQTVCRELLK